jgi:hypothetical protein
MTLETVDFGGLPVVFLLALPQAYTVLGQCVLQIGVEPTVVSPGDISTLP